MAKVFIDTYTFDFTKEDSNGFTQYQQIIQHMFKYDAECKLPFEAELSPI